MTATTVLIKDAIITAHNKNTIIDIFESDRVLYANTEFRGVTIKFGENVRSHSLHGCLLRDCTVIAPKDVSKSQILLGYNTMLGGTYNGGDNEDFRTNT